MTRWLGGLLLLIILLAFVLPDPVRAGNTTGAAINSVVSFVKSAGSSVMSQSGGVAGTGPGGVGTYPYGGVESGDGSVDGVLGGTSLQGLDAAAESPAVPVANAVPGLAFSAPVQLHIPAIGVTSGFVPLGLGLDGSLDVPSSAGAVGWYTDAPAPGQNGPGVVTAHVDWEHQLGAFHDLGRLRPGNDVTIGRADGTTVTFRVTRVAAFPKAHFPTQEVYGSTADAQLRLITCGGRFDTLTRSYDDNIVVFATMVGHT
jgi:Sortase domain